MKIRILFLVVFFLFSINSFAESSTKRIVLMDRHAYYINAISDALKGINNIEEYRFTTTPDWGEERLIGRINPHLTILHISCFLDTKKPNDQEFWKELLSFIEYMERYQTKFLLYSSSPYLKTDKAVKSHISQIEKNVPALKGKNRVFIFQDPSKGMKDVDFRKKETALELKRLVKNILEIK